MSDEELAPGGGFGAVGRDAHEALGFVLGQAREVLGEGRGEVDAVAALDRGHVDREVAHERVHHVAAQFVIGGADESALDRQRSGGDRVAAGVRRMLAATRGDVLAFLPGAGEIERGARELGPLTRRQGLLVLALHGSQDAEELKVNES